MTISPERREAVRIGAARRVQEQEVGRHIRRYNPELFMKLLNEARNPRSTRLDAMMAAYMESEPTPPSPPAPRVTPHGEHDERCENQHGAPTCKCQFRKARIAIQRNQVPR